MKVETKYRLLLKTLRALVHILPAPAWLWLVIRLQVPAVVFGTMLVGWMGTRRFMVVPIVPMDETKWDKQDRMAWLMCMKSVDATKRMQEETFSGEMQKRVPGVQAQGNDRILN